MRCSYRQLQRGRLSAAGLTQCATFGAEQVTSQRRPRELVLHEVTPVSLLPLPLLVMLLVLVTTFVPASELLLELVVLLVLVWLLLLLLTLMLLDAAPALLTEKQSRRVRKG